jgi:excisionase family DNA binding protein
MDKDRPEAVVDTILNIKEACEFLGITKRTMYTLLKERKIPARKIGGQWRFSKQLLLDMFRPDGAGDRE